MADHDETRDPPGPTTGTHAPGSGTPTSVPALHGTIDQTPEQASVSAEVSGGFPTVPGYQILAALGEGGMGIVYRAKHIVFDRDVAIKLLKHRFATGSAALRRFLEEARITGQLQHPAIPPVHELGTLPDGRPYLVMKLIKGETLAELLDRKPAERGQFVTAFAQVCQAVAYAHARKVVHRDLKPTNVMVGAFGEVQVMDWGLAKVLTGETREPSTTEHTEEATEIRTGREPDLATQTGSVLGTPAYMAPEQAAGEVEKIDERSDVFGLGAVLCTILTGKPPYSGPSADAIRLKAIRCETAEALARLAECNADPELVSLCKRCLAADRDTRPRDAGEVAKAVTAHLAAAEERARQAELDRVRSEEQRKQRRVQFVLAAAVLLLLALTAFGAGLASLWQDAEGAKKDAVKAQEAETKARKTLEVFEYGRTIQVAYQEWRDNNIAGARALLEGTKPELRGWEWDYVHRLCNSSLLTLKGHTNHVTSVSFSADGSRIVTSSNDQTAKVWDAKTGAETLTLKGHAGNVTSASFSIDGSLIVTGSSDKTAKVWDAKTGTAVFTLKGHTDSVLSASFSPDGSRIVTGGEDNTAKVWDAKTGTAVLALEGHTNYVNSASFSADGSRIVTGSGDKTAKVWNAKTGAELLTLEGHKDSVLSASFSVDGSRIVTGSYDNTAKVWDAKTGTELLTLKGHTSVVYSASFSADGSRILTGSVDATAKVWDVKTGAEVLLLKGHTNLVSSASFSADGSRIVTGSYDKTAKVWDAKTGTAVLALEGHTSYVNSASFSVDGSRIVTGSYDKTAKVWDAKTGAEMLTLKGHTDKVYSASFSADGSRILTGSKDKTAKIWDATPLDREFLRPVAFAVWLKMRLWDATPLDREFLPR